LFFASRLNALQHDLPAQEKLVKEEKKKVSEGIKAAVKYEDFLDQLAIDRSQELDDIRERRKDAIIVKLTELGWGDEIDALNEREPYVFIHHPIVYQPRDLTDRIWSNNQQKLVEFLEQCKAERLARARRALIRSRIEKLTLYVGKYAAANSAEIIPGFADICFEMKEMAALGSLAHFSKLKKRFQLLNCVQLWDLKTTKTGDEVLHKFEYWGLFTHSVFERTDNNLEFTVSKSSIDLNEASINQVFRHMNASLAWRWFLLGREGIVQPQSLMHHVQGVHSKVMILLDLMEEVNNCRKYCVIPHFRLQSGSDFRLNLQFSDSKLLFDFVLSFDMKQVTQLEMNQKLDCTVQIESAGRFFGTKISEADIKRSVDSVVPGHHLLLRVCASINTLILSFKE